MSESNTTDQRMIYAREFLAGARRRKVDELPPSVMTRELAEARRLLGTVLDVIADYEDEALDLEFTQVTISGGALLAPGEVLVLRNALADAITYRRDEGGECADCGRYPLSACLDHLADERAADGYAALAAALGLEMDL